MLGVSTGTIVPGANVVHFFIFKNTYYNLFNIHEIKIQIIIILIYYIHIALNTKFLSALKINVLLPRLCPASLI